MNYCILKMLYFHRIDVSERIDGNIESKECDICHHWYFLSKAFRFQTNVCNRCYDLLRMCMNVSDISILNIKGFDYTVILAGLAKMRP